MLPIDKLNIIKYQLFGKREEVLNFYIGIRILRCCSFCIFICLLLFVDMFSIYRFGFTAFLSVLLLGIIQFFIAFNLNKLEKNYKSALHKLLEIENNLIECGGLSDEEMEKIYQQVIKFKVSIIQF